MNIGEVLLTRIQHRSLLPSFPSTDIASPLSYPREVAAACLSQGMFKIVSRMCGTVYEQQL
jgi:hypothetical protein